MTSLKRASFHATVGWVIMVCTALSYSSYFSYRNTNSDHKWACSAARRTFKIKNYFHQMQSPGLSLRECRARDSPRLLWMWPSPTCIGKWKKNKTKRNPRSLNVSGKLPTCTVDMILQVNFLKTVSALKDFNEVRQHRTSNLLQAKNFWACNKSYHLRGQQCKQLKYTDILLYHRINWCLCCFFFFTNDLPFSQIPCEQALWAPIALWREWSQDSSQII